MLPDDPRAWNAGKQAALESIAESVVWSGSARGFFERGHHGGDRRVVFSAGASACFLRPADGAPKDRVVLGDDEKSDTLRAAEFVGAGSQVVAGRGEVSPRQLAHPLSSV